MHFLTKLVVIASCILPALAQANCNVVGDVVVVPDDNLGLIAQRANVTLDQLLYVNPNITNKNYIVPGQCILIPNHDCQAPKPVTPPPVPVPCLNVQNYTVQAGETLYTIATEKLGITLAALEAANPQIPNFNQIVAGQVINVPPCPAPSTQRLRIRQDDEANLPDCVTGGNATYIVVANDTLTSIAHDKLKIKLKALENANTDIVNFDFIVPGQKLNVPLCLRTTLRVRQNTKTCVDSDDLTHTVKHKESFLSIATEYGLTFESLAKANSEVNDLRNIKRGDVLNLPACATKIQERATVYNHDYKSCPNSLLTVTIKTGDTILDICAAYHVTFDDFKAVNDPKRKSWDVIFPKEVFYLPLCNPHPTATRRS